MDEIFANLAIGFSTALTPMNLMWVVIGGFLGTVIGMLPGLGPATGVAILIPISYSMDPTTALVTMCAIYYGAMFGGSRASIMINTPGDASAIVTCFDGYPMTKNGEAGKALGISAIASFFGGMVGMIFLVFFTLPVAKLALKFGPAEMFSLLILALTATVTLAQGNLMKGFFAMALGFMIGTMGIDPQSGIFRFTFGVEALQDGVDFLVAMIGLYAVAEVFKNYRTLGREVALDTSTIGKVWVSWKDFKQCLGSMIRSSPLGFVVGVLPGMGGTVATFMSYAMEKGLSKNPEKFGKGAIEGVAAPESANNASSCGALVPLLTLGIPGSGTTAVMLGALMMLGVRPGPVLFQMHPEIAWGVIASMMIGNVVLLLINMPLAIPLVQLLKIPTRIMLPLILGMAFMGTYFLNYSPFDFVLVTLFALGGFLLMKLDVPLPPLVLALILGETVELNFRNAMTISGGNLMFFLERPLSATFLGLAGLSLVYFLWKNRKDALRSP
jgi:putative tricarboxylic transport membrane protein